jgi:hypothetical protein
VWNEVDDDTLADALDAYARSTYELLQIGDRLTAEQREAITAACPFDTPTRENILLDVSSWAIAAAHALRRVTEQSLVG